MPPSTLDAGGLLYTSDSGSSFLLLLLFFFDDYYENGLQKQPQGKSVGIRVERNGTDDMALFV